jgi:hypothetical protein
MGQAAEGIDRSYHHAEAHKSSAKFLSASLVHSPSDQRLPEVLIAWNMQQKLFLVETWLDFVTVQLSFQNGRDNVMRMNFIAFQRTALMPIMRQR